MKVRQKAWEILIAVFIHGKYANLIMRSALDDLSVKDKALVTQIVYGTIRNYRLLFYQFADLYHKEPDYRIKLLLALSGYQLFFLEKVPEYAIINEAVDLAKGYKSGAFANLVNALLRAILRRGIKQPQQWGWRYSFPDFIVELIEKQYDENLLLSFLQASNENSFVSLRANSLKITTAELLRDERFILVERQTLRYQGDIFASAYYKKGEVVVQDASSQIAAQWLNPQAGDRVLDVCAAPGTKTSQLAQMMNDQGRITAVDIHPHRLALLEKEMRRQGISIVETLALDAVKLAEVFPAASFKAILLDAPCSGLGVLKGKPEIKLHLKPQDLVTLQELQKSLLSAVATLLQIKGKLVYSTCSLNLKENQRQIAEFLRQHKNYELQRAQTIWPNNVHDGFYIAELLRVY